MQITKKERDSMEIKDGVLTIKHNRIDPYAIEYKDYIYEVTDEYKILKCKKLEDGEYIPIKELITGSAEYCLLLGYLVDYVANTFLISKLDVKQRLNYYQTPSEYLKALFAMYKNAKETNKDVQA